MRAICVNCTLKRSPERSNTEDLAGLVLRALEGEGVETETVRLVDHQVDPGVISEAVSDGDEWPEIRRRIVAADILVVATPTWVGQPSSVSKRLIERMNAFLAEMHDDGETPIAFNRVAGVVVTGNEDGAHHCISEISGALIDTGYTIPGQAWTYWNKGPGPSDDEWLTTDESEWSAQTARTAAQNLHAVARALQQVPMPPPSS